MPRYLIERNIAKAGQLTDEQLQGIAQKSNGVIKEMAPRAQWVHSYITDDKLFCEYLADDPETLREHAQRGGFPITNIFRVHGFFDPVTAEV